MSEAVRQLETLYQSHGAALLVYLRRVGGGAVSAEDLLQETFVQALRRVQRLDEVESPRAWLFAIARNVGINVWRRRRSTVSLSNDTAAVVADADDPRLERMRGAIADLPDRLREPLELRLRHELTYEEIATVLSIPVGTVRSRLHYAVRQLREVLNTGEADHG